VQTTPPALSRESGVSNPSQPRRIRGLRPARRGKAEHLGGDRTARSHGDTKPRWGWTGSGSDSLRSTLCKPCGRPPLCGDRSWTACGAPAVTWPVCRCASALGSRFTLTVSPSRPQSGRRSEVSGWGGSECPANWNGYLAKCSWRADSVSMIGLALERSRISLVGDGACVSPSSVTRRPSRPRPFPCRTGSETNSGSPEAGSRAASPAAGTAPRSRQIVRSPVRRASIDS
jgi:hypothetical protein